MKDDFLKIADEEGQMDDLFRQGLADQKIEPSGSLWKGISRKLMWGELLRFNFTNLSRIILIGGAATVAILVTVAYVTLRQGPAPVSPFPGSPAGTSDVGLSTTTGTPAPVSVTPVSSKADPNTSTTVNSGSSVVTMNAAKPLEKYPQHESSLLRDPAFTATAGIGTSASLKPDEVVTPSHTSDHFPITQIDPLTSPLLLSSPATDTLVIVTPSEIIRINRDAISNRQFFAVSLGVAPEAIFYQSPESYVKVNFWVNAGLTWNISRFSVGIAPGLGFINDEGRYRIEYKSNDSVGFYHNVVSYTINPITNQIVYNTEKKIIYDSIVHMADDRTKNRYTYLQIPLLFGYRIFESTHLSLSIQAGPAVSFLVDTRESEPVIDYPNARIIKIENSTPARVKTNWQAWAGLYLEYRISKEVSLYFQPVYKYYFSPVVEQEHVSYGKPWSVGAGVGLQFNFGQKRRQP